MPLRLKYRGMTGFCISKLCFNSFAPEVQGYDRLGETHYAGDACVYLASDMSFISGQIINGDGAGHFGCF